MELLPFQIEASAQIAERFQKYMEDPLTISRSGAVIVPFSEPILDHRQRENASTG